MPSNGKVSAAGPAGAPDKLTHKQIAGIVGDIDDIFKAEIIATGATIEELEEAVAWAARESDVMADLRLRGSSVVGKVYDLLTAEEKLGDERG